MQISDSPIPVNQKILEMEYAVRGPIAQRAEALRQMGKNIIPCNIGNPQALGQTPLTYLRKVLSLVEHPVLIARERQIKDLFEETPGHPLKEENFLSEDILSLSETILSQSVTGTGAYTKSKGFDFIRRAIADFIDRRDGCPDGDCQPANPEHIFLTNGASQGATFIIEVLISGKKDGIMIPIPQYPLYSATIKKAGGTQINYYPDEDRGWLFDRNILEGAYAEARKNGITPKAIVVINPANPTGAILQADCMWEIADFAMEHKLVIIADEVYQENIYQGEFTSFAKIIGTQPVPLVSLHSISKGFYGECGHRGGYMEVRNPPAIQGYEGNLVDILEKMASVSLCSNTPGQILTYLMVSPPPPNSPTHARFSSEKERILAGLFEKATMIREAFKEMEGVECFGETGAMYLFPRLNILPGGTTDFDYCMALLEATGICTVNGSGFGQAPNTHHLRIAFLPPKETLNNVLPAWIEFHNSYIHK
jgi:aspartate/methionine/tyrosine aminotransferase